MAVVQTVVSNAEIIDRFLDAVWQEAGLRENTLSAYRNDLGQFSKWLSNRQPYLLKASRSDVLAYLAASVKRGISAKSSARRLSTLRRFYRHLLRETLIDVDPTSEIASPVTGRPLPISLSEDAVTQLLEAPNVGTALGLRDHAMIEHGDVSSSTHAGSGPCTWCNRDSVSKHRTVLAEMVLVRVLFSRPGALASPRI